MSYVNYNPWTDAAQYGRGMGDTISEALLRVPAMRAQQQRQRAEFPLQQRLTEAQIASLNVQPELTLLRLMAQQQNWQSQAAEREAMAKYYGAKTEQAEQPKGDTPSQSMSALAQIAAAYAAQKAKLQTQSGGIPVNADPGAPFQLASQYQEARDAGTPAGQSIAAVLGQIMSATNRPNVGVTNVSNASMFNPTSWGTTKQQPVTNSFDMIMPQQPMNQGVAAPQLQQPPQQGARVRVRGPNGESGTIQQGDALPQGWQAIQ